MKELAVDGQSGDYLYQRQTKELKEQSDLWRARARQHYARSLPWREC